MTWQAASLALAAGAIAIGALPIAGLLGPGKGAKPKDVTITVPTSGAESMSQTRVMRLTDALNHIAGKVDVEVAAVETDPVETAGGTDPEPTPPPPAAVSWSYVGNVRRADGQVKLAIINVENGGNPGQRMLGEGESVDNTKLVAIAADHIMISVSGAEPTRVDLAQRQANAAWTTESRPRATAGRPMPGQPGFNPGMNPGMNPATNPMNPNLAEAQRRMKAAISPPTNPMAPLMQPGDDRMTQLARTAKDMGEMTPDKRDALNKIMDDPGLSPEERGRMLSEFGIPIDVSPDERGEYLHMIGITPENDPKLYERLRDAGGQK